MLKITVLQNCAVIIGTNEGALVFDAFSRGCEPFEGISAENLTAAMSGREPFKNVKALLYTHTHADHYDEALTRDYIDKFGVPAFVPEKDMGKRGRFSISGFDIEFYRIHHSGAEFADVIHYVFLVSAGDKLIYIGGDADFNSDEHFAFLADRKPDAAFLNPFYLSAMKPVIKNIAAKQTYIYHIPSYEDSEGIRKMAYNSFSHNKELWDSCLLIGEHPYIIQL